MENFKMGDVVLGRYNEGSGYITEWEKVEFLKYEKDMEHGKYICLSWTHDGKVVECFDEIKRIEK